MRISVSRQSGKNADLASVHELANINMIDDRPVASHLSAPQPMAIDLRNVVAAIKISTALERFGDYAANIAKRCALLILFCPPSSPATMELGSRLQVMAPGH